MSILIPKTNERTELQKRIEAELVEKAKKRAEGGDSELLDGVTDSAYIKDTKQTTSLAWVWLLIGIAAVVAIVWLVVATS